MKSFNCLKKNSGFTLIELLVVISIISILFSALFLVLNPAQLQRKARETVLQTTTSKLCNALNACFARTGNINNCFSSAGVFDPLGVQAPTEPDNTYSFVKQGTDTLVLTGSESRNDCQYFCWVNFNDGDFSNVVSNDKCITTINGPAAPTAAGTNPSGPTPTPTPFLVPGPTPDPTCLSEGTFCNDPQKNIPCCFGTCQGNGLCPAGGTM